MAYFERVLRAANQRLKVASQNRYVLMRKEEGGDGRKRVGLEIEVADSYTGKSCSANSLSGDESFMASLSLALGLSDVVQQSASGVHLDAMFIDEGFGSLDAEVLNYPSEHPRIWRTAIALSASSPTLPSFVSGSTNRFA